MRLRRMLLVAAALLWALPAGAQQAVKLEFNGGGRVTLSAENAPVRVILQEWARLGGATIVNADRLTGPPVTLELSNVSERQALDILLRNAAGYMLAPRRPGTDGVSAFDRILILPTSTAPRNPPPPPAAASPVNGPRPIVLPRPPVPVPVEPQPEPFDPAVEEPDTDDPNADPAARPTPPAGVPRPLIPQIQRPGTVPDNAPAEEPVEDAPVGVQPAPGNPFGVPFGSSSQPGVIATPRPEPNQPQGR